MQATGKTGALHVGESAPQSRLTASDGSTIALSSFWESAASGALVVFLRHFGCLFCREQAKLLRDALGEFEQRGVTVVAIGLGTPEDAAGFAEWLKLPYPVLGHPDPSIHAEWGLGKASTVSMINPALMKSGFRAIKTGSVQGRQTGDSKQLPGVFLVDQHGKVRWARPGTHPGDNPLIEEVLAAVDAALGT